MSRKRNAKRTQPPENSAEPIAFYIEEAVVNLHALAHYHARDLTPHERQFLAQAKKNLAVMHRRHASHP